MQATEAAQNLMTPKDQLAKRNDSVKLHLLWPPCSCPFLVRFFFRIKQLKQLVISAFTRVDLWFDGGEVRADVVPIVQL